MWFVNTGDFFGVFKCGYFRFALRYGREDRALQECNPSALAVLGLP
jgi:hypothetical protein